MYFIGDDYCFQERHKALEEMGISIQSSGIAVEKNKFYLVNLNADPSLNELLVYYLKERTVVGRHDAANHTVRIFSCISDIIK